MDTLESRTKKLEIITSRLSRRSQKIAKALITPYPISNAVFADDIKGSILRYMFPCDGTIVKGMIRLGSKPKNGISLVVRIFSDIDANSKEFLIDDRVFAIKPSISVSGGDCLDISVLSKVADEILTEIWISFLWIPTVKDVEVKSFLIDELENANNQEVS